MCQYSFTESIFANRNRKLILSVCRSGYRVNIFHRHLLFNLFIGLLYNKDKFNRFIYRTGLTVLAVNRRYSHKPCFMIRISAGLNILYRIKVCGQSRELNFSVVYLFIKPKQNRNEKNEDLKSRIFYFIALPERKHFFRMT